MAPVTTPVTFTTPLPKVINTMILFKIGWIGVIGNTMIVVPYRVCYWNKKQVVPVSWGGDVEMGIVGGASMIRGGCRRYGG